MVMRERFKKIESEGSNQAFTDHPQTALKEFMVFNTNSDILPHIIEQALRQRAFLTPSWALIAIPTFCCLWQHWRCKLLIPKDSDCEVNLPFHFVLNCYWVEVPFHEATKSWSWSAIATKLWKCEAEVGKYLCYQVLLPLLLWLPLEIPGLVVPIYTATHRYIPLHYSAASFTRLFVWTMYNINRFYNFLIQATEK